MEKGASVDTKRSAEILPNKVASIKHSHGEKDPLPPLLFQHLELFHVPENAPVIDQRTLINKLNHIHFMDGYICALLRLSKYDDWILLRAYSTPPWAIH